MAIETANSSRQAPPRLLTIPRCLVYLNARCLSPDVGRFLSIDPVWPGAAGATGYNTYTYVTNNPTTWTDTSGEFELVAEGLNLKKSHLDSMP